MLCAYQSMYLENCVLLTQKNHIKLLIDVKIFRKALGENILISLNGLLCSESKFAHVSNALGISKCISMIVYSIYVCSRVKLMKLTRHYHRSHVYLFAVLL